MLLHVCYETKHCSVFDNFQPVEWPTTGTMSRKTVEEYCRLKIAESDLGKQCRRLLHITFDKEIEGCMEDVKVRLAVSYTHNSRTHAQACINAHMHICAHMHTHFEMFTCMLNRYFTNSVGHKLRGSCLFLDPRLFIITTFYSYYSILFYVILNYANCFERMLSTKLCLVRM